MSELRTLRGSEVVFRNERQHVRDLRTVEAVRTECVRNFTTAVFVNSCPYDRELADLHHAYHDGDAHYQTPYPAAWVVGTGRGVLNEGDETYVNGYPVAKGESAAPRRARETITALTTSQDEVVPVAPTSVVTRVPRHEGDDDDDVIVTFFDCFFSVAVD